MNGLINTQYVGARYVPKLMGEWNKALEYEALSIVTYNNNSFTSKIPVPQNTDINNTKYWVNTGNYNAQVEKYRQETLELQNEFNLKNTYLNIKEYGAVGDGQHDDTTALNEALNKAKETGKTLFIPVGTYVITETITLTALKGVTIRGERFSEDVVNNSTKIKFTGVNSLFKIYGAYNFKIEDISFFGNSSNKIINFNYLVDEHQSVVDSRLGFVYFNNVGFFNCVNAIEFNSPCGYVYLNKCYFRCVGTSHSIDIGVKNTTNYGIMAGYIFIENSAFEGIDMDENSTFIRIHAGQFVSIENCDFANLNSTAIEMNTLIDLPSKDVDNITFTNNTVFHCLNGIIITETHRPINNIQILSNKFIVNNIGVGVNGGTKTFAIFINNNFFNLLKYVNTKYLDVNKVKNITCTGNMFDTNTRSDIFAFCNFADLSGKVEIPNNFYLNTGGIDSNASKSVNLTFDNELIGVSKYRLDTYDAPTIIPTNGGTFTYSVVKYDTFYSITINNTSDSRSGYIILLPLHF